MVATKTRDPANHLPLHPLEFRVLLVLLNGELHGYGIAKEIERRDKSLGRIFPTNLYRRLRDMSERGLIDHLPASADGDGKRQFRITEFGRVVAQEEARRLQGLVLDASAHNLISPFPPAGDA
jgi:DNA-binding PadR family transcriptional regulator